METTSDYWTVQELATKIKMAERTVQRWIEDGKIRATRFGRVWRIPADEAQRVVTEGIEDGK